MKVIQTVEKVQNNDIKIILQEHLNDEEVNVIIIAENELDEFEQRHQIMIKKGYDTPEKVLELIHKVKLKMLSEKGRVK